MVYLNNLLQFLAFAGIIAAKPQPVKQEDVDCRDLDVTPIPDMIEMPALGRPFGIGMLYDTHSDQLVTDYTVCPKGKLHQREERKFDIEKYTDIMDATRPSKKLDWKKGLKIPPDLQVSIAAELIEPKDEGHWIFDSPPNATTVQVSFIERYTWRDTKVDSIDQCIIHFAVSPLVTRSTHYVSEINHGSGHVIVLERSVSEFEFEKDTTDRLIGLGKLILNGDVKPLTGDDAKFLSSIKVRIYSSRGAGKNVRTVDDLVKYFRDQPFLDRDSSDPVWIKLKRIPGSERIIKGAGDYDNGVLDFKFIDSFHRNYFFAQKLLKSTAATEIKPYAERLKSFSENLLEYRHKFAKSFGDLIVQYRNGDATSCEINRLIDTWNDSLFSEYRLKTWLDLVAEELYQIQRSLDKLHTIPFTDQPDWIRVRSDCAVGLIFHVNSTNDDEFLHLQKQYLLEKLWNVPRDDGLTGIWSAGTDKDRQRATDRPVERFLEAFVEFAGDASFIAAYERQPSGNFAEITFSDACSEKFVNEVLSLRLD